LDYEVGTHFVERQYKKGRKQIWTGYASRKGLIT
jgi:hypothetical protein